MTKKELDQLYHLLRIVSNDDASGDTEERNAVIWLMKHLLEGGYYLGLIQFSAFYGERYLLDPTHHAIVKKGWVPERLVEFGAGLGWLSRGLALKYGIDKTLSIDKRPWTAVRVMADLEKKDDRVKVYDMLKDGDIIVMSDFLHCVEKPADIISGFSKWPMVILEYSPSDSNYIFSYVNQLARFGGNPIKLADFVSMLHNCGRPVETINLDSYILTLIDSK